MRRAILTAAALLLAIGTAGAGDYTEIFDQSYPMAHDGRVGLENINGDVTIEVWDQDEVRVYAVKSASSPERLALLLIEVDATGDRVFVDTHYPNSRDLSSGDRHGHSEVEYTLTVPRFALLDGIELVNGDLTVDGVEGGIGAQTVNGNIVVRGGDGEMDIETVNGSIELDFASTMSQEVDLSSVNGRIEVVLNGSADIRVETVNGSLRNDYGIEVKKGKYVGASMEGSVGGGGPVLDIETVNGSVSIR
jgi:DUF4097 and DUF4098 domain-containing protein YvlB